MSRVTLQVLGVMEEEKKLTADGWKKMEGYTIFACHHPVYPGESMPFVLKMDPPE